ncbi:DUF47 family protein [Candidatus Peregrinibacteria bacterium]|nr:DUF47 family protein [Candidatus Peregrinibacteria bacterium]MBI4129514.1 DUF47 family protein [Candidatus Peregrinibacteria bacterium]
MFLRFQLLPRNEKYFDLFEDMSRSVHKAADLLAEAFQHPQRCLPLAQQIKDLEHQCDDAVHTIVTRLNQSFITPIDREDIYALAKALDDVIDLTHTTATHLNIYNIDATTDASKHLAGILQESTGILTTSVRLLHSHAAALPSFIEIHRLENEGDRLYHAALATLFAHPGDTLSILKWKDIYSDLEQNIDCCEDVANVLESIILKHT